MTSPAFYDCFLNCTSSSVVNHVINTRCVLMSVGVQPGSPVFGPFYVDRFNLYCRGPRQNKHTQVIV